MHILKCDAHLLNILEEAEPAEGLVTAGTHLHHSSAPQASHTLKTCTLYNIVRVLRQNSRTGDEKMAKRLFTNVREQCIPFHHW
jgi:hypothetical protein